VVQGWYGRFRRWLQLEREQGRGLMPLLLWHLPRRLAAKTYAAAAGWINDRAFFTQNLSNFRDFRAALPPAPGPRFYLIVMPGTLHYLFPCVRLLPAGVSPVLLLNGVSPAEARLLRRRVPHLPRYPLAALPGSSLTHGGVLNLLFAGEEENFGILDHDLYVFKPEIFHQLNLEENTIAISAFHLYNRLAQLFFPTTHFLFFNLKLIINIIDKYHIGAQKYKKPPSYLNNLLEQLNLGPHNYLKDYLNYYDTLNLIWAMAVYEGYTFKFFPLSTNEYFYHLGATSHGVKDLYKAYVQQRFLELPENREVARLYGHGGPGSSGAEALRHRLPSTATTEGFLQEIDRLMARLSG
jgi:hypothetical protein